MCVLLGGETHQNIVSFGRKCKIWLSDQTSLVRQCYIPNLSTLPKVKFSLSFTWHICVYVCCVFAVHLVAVPRWNTDVTRGKKYVSEVVECSCISCYRHDDTGLTSTQDRSNTMYTCLYMDTALHLKLLFNWVLLRVLVSPFFHSLYELVCK